MYLKPLYYLEDFQFYSPNWFSKGGKRSRWSGSKDLVLVKKDMLHYVKDVRGMERRLSYHHMVLRKVRIVGAWIKRRGGWWC